MAVVQQRCTRILRTLSLHTSCILFNRCRNALHKRNGEIQDPSPAYKLCAALGRNTLLAE
jgi:hypothetical protein